MNIYKRYLKAMCIVILLGALYIGTEEHYQVIIEPGNVELKNNLEEPPEKQSEFPEGMVMLDEEKSETPISWNFNYVIYVETSRIYTEKELEFIERSKEPEVFLIRNTGKEGELECVFRVLERDEICNDITIILEKEEDSNLYVGNIYSDNSNSKIIGKVMLSYQEKDIMVSVGYFNTDTQDYHGLSSGTHHYKYEIGELKEEELKKIKEFAGDKGVEQVYYMGYTGHWILHDSLLSTNLMYLDLEIDETGSVAGNIKYKKETGEDVNEIFDTRIIEDFSLMNGSIYVKFEEDESKDNFSIYFYNNGIGVRIFDGRESGQSLDYSGNVNDKYDFNNTSGYEN